MNSTTLITTMEDVVKEHVKAYQSDFYKYDIATITNMQPGERRFWIVRDTGTYLFSDPDLTNMVIDTACYVYFAVIYKNQYEYEYASMKKDAFKKELSAWIENNLMRVEDGLNNGIIYGKVENNVFYPVLSSDKNNIYVNSGEHTEPYNALKTAIYDDLGVTPYHVLNMEQRTIDNWYL